MSGSNGRRTVKSSTCLANRPLHRLGNSRYGGEPEIRTQGTLTTPGRFRGVCNNPLCQLAVEVQEVVGTSSSDYKSDALTAVLLDQIPARLGGTVTYSAPRREHHDTVPLTAQK